MPQFFELDVAPLFVLLGVVLFLTAHHLWLWRIRHNDTFHLWGSFWSLIAAVFLFGRLLQRSADVADIAALGVRLQLSCAFLIGILSVGAIRSVFGYPKSRRLLIGVAAVSLGFTLVTLTTSLIVSDAAYMRTDAFGTTYLAMRSGAFAPAVLVYAVAIGILCFSITRRGTSTFVYRRRAFRVMVIVLFVFGLNDLLVMIDVIRSVHLFEYGFALTALGNSYQLHGRIVNLERDLEIRAEELRQHRKRIEGAAEGLRRSEARFRELAEATLEGVAVLEDGMIADSNGRLSELLGFANEELVGRAATELFDEKTQHLAEAIFAGRSTVPVQGRAMRSDGAAISVEIMCRRIAGEVERREILTVRDITSQRELQAQLLAADRLATLGSLAAGTAHEINNPLAYAFGNVELLVEEMEAAGDNLPSELRENLLELLHDVADGLERVRRIVRDLKSLSRGSAEDPGPCDVHESLESAIQIANNEIRHRAVLVRNYGDVALAAVPAGPLGQVFLNLLVNATQALTTTSKSENQIEIRTFSNSDGFVVIEIADNGPGIPPVARARIFDPFFTTKPLGVGTGLGLSICQSIMTDMGGTIAVESEPGEGTLFRICVPSADPDSPRTSSLARRTSDPVITIQPARVLVVDDEVAVTRLVARILRKHEVTTVYSGIEAIERCASESYDVILCDLMMPGINGMEVYERIRNQSPSAAGRFVFVTGGAFTAEATEFLDSIDNPVLKKPFDAAELRQLVDEIVG